MAKRRLSKRERACVATAMAGALLVFGLPGAAWAEPIASGSSPREGTELRIDAEQARQLREWLNARRQILEAALKEVDALPVESQRKHLMDAFERVVEASGARSGSNDELWLRVWLNRALVVVERLNRVGDPTPNEGDFQIGFLKAAAKKALELVRDDFDFLGRPMATGFLTPRDHGELAAESAEFLYDRARTVVDAPARHELLASLLGFLGTDLADSRRLGARMNAEVIVPIADLLAELEREPPVGLEGLTNWESRIQYAYETRVRPPLMRLYPKFGAVQTQKEIQVQGMISLERRMALKAEALRKIEREFPVLQRRWRAAHGPRAGGFRSRIQFNSADTSDEAMTSESRWNSNPEDRFIASKEDALRYLMRNPGTVANPVETLQGLIGLGVDVNWVPPGKRGTPLGLAAVQWSSQKGAPFRSEAAGGDRASIVRRVQPDTVLDLVATLLRAPSLDLNRKFPIAELPSEKINTALKSRCGVPEFKDRMATPLEGFVMMGARDVAALLLADPRVHVSPWAARALRCMAVNGELDDEFLKLLAENGWSDAEIESGMRHGAAALRRFPPLSDKE